MAMVHKIMHEQGHLNPETWFARAERDGRVTRSAADPLNIRERHGRLELRKNFFSMRVIENWNNVPGEVTKIVKKEQFRKKYKMLRAR